MDALTRKHALRRSTLTAVADRSGLRLTVDYPYDLLMVRELVARLGAPQYHVDIFDMLRCLQAEPALVGMSQHARNEGLARSRSDDLTSLRSSSGESNQ